MRTRSSSRTSRRSGSGGGRRDPRSAAEASLHELAAATRDVVALVGFPHFDRDLYNACAVCADGEVKAIYHKRFLPNYGVFDEYRDERIAVPEPLPVPAQRTPERGRQPERHLGRRGRQQTGDGAARVAAVWPSRAAR